MCNNLTITLTVSCPEITVMYRLMCPHNAFQFGPILITDTDYFPQQQ